MSQTSTENNSDHAQEDGFAFWIALIAVYVLLCWYALERVPIPGVNEPHYLGKAKHFWQPDWCAQDQFLQSSNPHLVFYATLGSLTQFWSLELSALIGRLTGLIIVAIGWNLLSFRLTHRPLVGVVSLSLFLLFQSAGNWSGEWLVGGIESKVIAYGFLFISIAEALVLRIRSSALFAGLVVSFHPVIGIWGIACAIGATLLFVTNRPQSDGKYVFPSLLHWVVATALCLIAAIPGLVPAVKSVLSADPELSRIANILQIGYRLPHHLDPMAFPKHAYRYFVILVIGWLFFTTECSQDFRRKWWNLFVFSSLLIAITGVAIGWGPRPVKEMPGYEWRLTFLKFYPFRLADLLIPVALSFSIAMRTVHKTSLVFSSKRLQKISIVFLCLLLMSMSLWIPGADANPSKMSPERQKRWIATCDWVQKHSDSNSLIHSFDVNWAVKWYAERSEYFNFKDCPQDAEGIVEWNQRNWVIARWKEAALEDGIITMGELRAFSQKTGATLFVCHRFGPFEQDPDYSNADFRVYRVTRPR